MKATKIFTTLDHLDKILRQKLYLSNNPIAIEAVGSEVQGHAVREGALKSIMYGRGV